jgi:hypothetical protein
MNDDKRLTIAQSKEQGGFSASFFLGLFISKSNISEPGTWLLSTCAGNRIRVMRKVVVCFVIICIAGMQVLSAQDIGVNRGSIKWHQINNSAARIIFPDGQDSLAQRVATIAEALAKNHRATIGPYLQKIDVIIQSENTVSNAYVGLGPYRSEMYMTPPQNPFYLGSNGWADQLTIHEFRHVQQFSNFNVGLSKVGTLLGGQYGRAIANNMAIPDWFWEGDAVWNETIHSPQGRGRLPYFFNAYRSLDKEGKNYSWMKLRNGSFKDYIPNHYDLGYLLIAHGREQYGDTIWRNITHDAASFRGLFYPMQKAVKRYTGVEYHQFVKEAFDRFETQWQQQQYREPQWITDNQPRNVVDYKYPYPYETGGTVALKITFRDIPAFVIRDQNGGETKISVKDISIDDYFGYNNQKIVYAAYQPDPRWANREYSAIRILDIVTKKQSTISTKSRYFSPDISQKSDKVVAVEVLPGKPSLLHVLDTTGNMLNELLPDSNLFFSHPKWLSDGKRVVVAAREPSGNMGWLLWNTETGTTQWLLTPAPRLVGFPVVQEDTLTFSHSANGKDGLRSLLLSNGSLIASEDYGTGIYQGFLHNGLFEGSVFTTGGFRLGQWPTIDKNVQNDLAADAIPDLYVPKTLSRSVDLSKIVVDTFPVEKFKKSNRILNFHSWIPELNEPDYTFTIYGENVLATLSSELSYNYNVNETSHQAGLRLLFGDTYLMPFVNANTTFGRSIKLNQDTTLNLNEGEFGVGLLLPLNLTGGKYGRNLTLSSSVNIEKQFWQGLAKSLLVNQEFISSSNRLVYVAQTQRAVQQIYPRFGQTLIADYRTIISNQKANQLLLSGALYLPGLHKNHSLVLTAAYQARDTMLQYLFNNSFPFARGYNSLNFPRMWRLGVNYHMPVFYPDWGFGDMIYFRRIRSNLFFDHTWGKSLRTGIITPFATLGTELFFDMQFWNVQPLSIGIRYSHLLNNDLRTPGRTGLFEIVLPVNLFGR